MNQQWNRLRAPYVAGFRQGLKEAGFIEGQNVAIEFRWAENQNDRLPALAAELVRRQVSVIATLGSGAMAASRDNEDSGGLPARRGPCQARSCRQPGAARRQRDRTQSVQRRDDCEAA